MECLGGAGYVETGPMPRLFRQSPLNAIWEGSGNVIALDVLRAMTHESEAIAALRTLLASAAGRHPAYDAWIDGLKFGSHDESRARHIVERLALATQAAILLAAESPVAEAFCRLRLERPSLAYGASDAVIDARSLIDRAMPGSI